MSLQTLIPLVLKVSIFLTVFVIGLHAQLRDLTYLFRRPGELVRALLSIYVIMPLFAATLVLLFHLHPAIKIVLIALAVSPIPPLLPNKLTKSGATVSYSVGLLAALGFLSIVFVPLAMEIFQRVFDVELHMSIGSVTLLIFQTVLLPLGIGMVARYLAPLLAERVAKPISQISGIALLLCGLAIIFSAAQAIWMLIGNGTLLALAAFVIVGLISGHFLGGPGSDNRAALAISTASRHPGIAIALAHANFPQQKLAMAAVLLYLLVNAVVSIPYNLWLKRQGRTSTTHVEA